MMKKHILPLSLCLLLAACSVKLMVPNQTDVDRVSDKFPNYTLANLSEGKTLYQNHCGSCHKLKKPSDLTEEQWRDIVPKMARKVNKKENNVLDERKQDLILKYLLTMRDAPKR